MNSKWFNMTPPVGPEDPAEICIFDEIGGFGIGATQFDADLKALGSPAHITVRIHSPGGSIVDGLAIYNMLKNHAAKKTVRIDGLAASMASVVAMAGDEIVMPKTALMMIHNPWTLAMGDAEELRNEADVLDRMKQTLVAAYASKTGIPSPDIEKMMDDEKWMDGEEAVALKFATRMDGEIRAAAKLDVAKFCAKMPPAAKAFAREDLPPPIPSIEERLAVARETGRIEGRDERTAELSAELSAIQARLSEEAEKTKQQQAELESAKSEAARLAQELAASREAIAALRAEYEEGQRKHAALLGGLAFEPELTWPDALKKCGNDYAKARTTYPAAYSAFMEQCKHKGNRK